MNINEIIIFILAGFMVLGALDKIFGNKLGFGKQFNEGFMAMGPLAIAVVGIVSLAPVLARLLAPVLTPVYNFLGADPAIFAASFLANDMGGYPLAMELAQVPEAGLFAGLILGSMMGATIVFTIPVALSIIEKKDYKFLAQGVLIGIITIPLGCLIGGLVAGFGLALVISNLIPIIIVSVLVALGLWLIPQKMIKAFIVFGRAVIILTTTGTALIVFQTLTGITIVPGMAPVWDGLKIVGAVGIMLLGAFPLVYFVTRYLKKPLLKVGRRLGINEVAIAGLIASLANDIPMLKLLSRMDERGKVINIAFAVGAAFLLGDHLGFTAGVNQSMIFPVLAGKITAGVSAVLLAYWIITRKKKIKNNYPQPN